ncbi:GPW/gp25 family protein [Calothrix sp. FACHB-1219]|uniref:GPW/gp25 family protein n=1 Tax=unclassified Calothrix TaxID=2619626 RepID=UPI001682EEE4|nr:MULTISPECIES: GPW/gp25 family protein [unclassified Calothrix]MBD2207026.1 GPW/gp25 family protein [Calothrix sp. FACHB-168]MBD2221642.1 GPW/gp25 family protein [Calothrix sp. FACHB-1219]
MSREFLGVGWQFPMRINSRGGLSYSSNEQKIEESIWIILSTAKGERVMEPNFGCGIHDYVFAPNNPGTRGSIAYEVQAALTEFEPRINLESVRVESFLDSDNRLLIYVDYRVRTNNAKRNLVYPFYLTEP